jgi:hypothetical protein
MDLKMIDEYVEFVVNKLNLLYRKTGRIMFNGKQGFTYAFSDGFLEATIGFVLYNNKLLIVNGGRPFYDKSFLKWLDSRNKKATEEETAEVVRKDEPTHKK